MRGGRRTGEITRGRHRGGMKETTLTDKKGGNRGEYNGEITEGNAEDTRKPKHKARDMRQNTSSMTQVRRYEVCEVVTYTHQQGEDRFIFTFYTY